VGKSSINEGLSSRPRVIAGGSLRTIVMFVDDLSADGFPVRHWKILLLRDSSSDYGSFIRIGWFPGRR
jgi:hypothetical protein